MSDPGLTDEGRRGTIDAGSMGTEVFPFDAFVFDPPSTVPPFLTLKSPWGFIAERFSIRPWSALITYYQYDIVFLNGGLWIAKGTTLNNTPPNATYWYGQRTYSA